MSSFQTADMSLRDSSAFCLQELVKYVAERCDAKMFEVVVMGHLIPELKLGLRQKQEVCVLLLAFH